MTEFLIHHPIALKLMLVGIVAFWLFVLRGIVYYVDHSREIDYEERKRRDGKR
jgi:hypothetical protein